MMDWVIVRSSQACYHLLKQISNEVLGWHGCVICFDPYGTVRDSGHHSAQVPKVPRIYLFEVLVFQREGAVQTEVLRPHMM